MTILVNINREPSDALRAMIAATKNPEARLQALATFYSTMKALIRETATEHGVAMEDFRALGSVALCGEEAAIAQVIAELGDLVTAVPDIEFHPMS